MNCIKPLLALMALCLTLGSGVGAQSTGMQFVGASKARTADIRAAADALAAAPRGVEIAALPFEFSPNRSFRRLTALVKRALPRTNHQLRVTVFGKWFPHLNSQGPMDDDAFWDAWAARNPSFQQRITRTQFKSRISAFAAWSRRIRQWAVQNQHDSRLAITFSPVLEDTCEPNQRRGYVRLIRAIRRIVGPGIDLRRSCLVPQAFRVPGVSLELHGTWREVRGHLLAGDTYSNDGTSMSVTAFVRAQRAARNRGINSLYWDQLYNGTPFATYNQSSRTVNPFSGPGGTGRLNDLNTVLSN